MSGTFADTHIHLEQYAPEEAERMLRQFRDAGGAYVVAVSMNLESARRTERLAELYPGLVRPAYGFHPEQPLPTPEEEEALFAWMERRTLPGEAAGASGALHAGSAHGEGSDAGRGKAGGARRGPAPAACGAAGGGGGLEAASASAGAAGGDSPRGLAAPPRMAAVGEVGLPYYSRQEAAERGEALDEAGYVRLLERFAAFAARHDLPIVLHAVYEDADTACDLLERFGVRRAHFHWFKGSADTVRRMIANGYFISFTPDILYEEEIRQLALRYPDSLVMSETDGPWPFEGPFAGRATHPSMTADVCREWASLRGLDEDEARKKMLANAERFYG
ncbi:TatD family hydrolase [Saccharibacillus alkalitolerans]|uniref:TatD family hydrolase n=1 Tax=Saccharibacillus alkalitolerans TaxID=2705290 RepID=A0ABX0FDM4_9BACL|nr:TatD family hydrolase [Saccharibacillus alkalitolerans]NGZ77928.1 TatD family hydrolase [Saccharibacillus alkalitolerans]